VEAGLPGPAAVLLAAVAGHRDQDDAGELGTAADLPGRHVAVHARQADVQQDDVGAEGLGLVEGLRAGVGHTALVPPELDDQAEAVRRRLVVVVDEHARLRRRGESRRRRGAIRGTVSDIRGSLDSG
jgi:hypothetical protein